MGVFRRVFMAVVAMSTAAACSANERPQAAASGTPGGSPSAAVSTWRPEVGQCHDIHSIRLSREAYAPADCAKTHVYQTVFVGEVTADDAKAAASPEIGTDEQVTYWALCAGKFNEYFGGKWMKWRLKVRVSFPSIRAWDAGQRWFSCHAAAFEDYRWTNTAITGSLQNGAQTRTDLKLGCMQWAGKYAPKACSEPHDAEFVGVLSWPEAKKDFVTGDKTEAHEACGRGIHSAVGSKVVTSTVVWAPLDTDWQMGDRYIRCFLAVDGKPVTKSLVPA